MTPLTEVLDDSTVKCGALGQRLELFRALGAEDKMKDGLVVVACARDKGESPLKGNDVRIGRKIFGQLFVEQPRGTRCDARGTAGLDHVKRCADAT